MKSKELLDSFMAFCIDHPELRFWQALTQWSGYLLIYGEKTNGELEDTYHLEKRNGDLPPMQSRNTTGHGGE